MPTSEMELRHLAQAERHIREGEIRVEAMERAITRASGLKMNTQEARLSLSLMVESLVHFREHKLLIQQALAAVDRRIVSGESRPRDPGPP